MTEHPASALIKRAESVRVVTPAMFLGVRDGLIPVPRTGTWSWRFAARVRYAVQARRAGVRHALTTAPASPP